jgi:hypothetical protein
MHSCDRRFVSLRPVRQFTRSLVQEGIACNHRQTRRKGQNGRKRTFPSRFSLYLHTPRIVFRGMASAICGMEGRFTTLCTARYRAILIECHTWRCTSSGKAANCFRPDRSSSPLWAAAPPQGLLPIPRGTQQPRALTLANSRKDTWSVQTLPKFEP